MVRFCSIVLIFSFFLPHNVIAQQYALVNLGSLGGPNSYGAAINSSGQITGWSDATPQSTFYCDAFLYGNGVMQDLGTAGTSYSVGTAINDNGQVTGYYTGGSFAFLYSNGVMHDLFSSVMNFGGPVKSYGINDSLQVTGYVAAGNGEQDYGFFLSNGVFANINSYLGFAINESGAVTGLSPEGTAFIFSSGAYQNLGVLKGGTASEGWAINVLGQVVGQSTYASSGVKADFYHAFLYDSGVMQDLGTLGGPNSFAYGMNDVGQIVGSADTGPRAYGSFIRHAFLYSNGAMVDLNKLIPSKAAQVYVLTDARGINNSGQIVANGYLKAKPTKFQLVFLLTPK